MLGALNGRSREFTQEILPGRGGRLPLSCDNNSGKHCQQRQCQGRRPMSEVVRLHVSIDTDTLKCSGILR
jgi:hypothetical protein